MTTSKLTLSADAAVIRKAKRLAREKKTSVSALFATYIEHLDEAGGDPFDEEQLHPSARRALGLAKLPDDNRPYREIMEEALLEKYGLDE